MKQEHQETNLIDNTMPHQISAPDFKNSDIQPQRPFVNGYGVVIGDSYYDSEQSPLNQWSIETDPAIMAGEEWVHPTNDIGWNTDENRHLVEGEVTKQRARFMHNTKDTGYYAD